MYYNNGSTFLVEFIVDCRLYECRDRYIFADYVVDVESLRNRLHSHIRILWLDDISNSIIIKETLA